MANNITVLGQIKPGGFEGVVDAEDVAYSYKTEGGINQIDKSLKDEIDKLKENINNTGNTADKIYYTYIQGESEVTTTVKSELDSLKSGVSNVESNAAATQQFYNQAVEIKSRIDKLKGEIEDTVRDTNLNIESLLEIAESFNTSFNADARFEIISSTTYNARKIANTLNPNCIYFCYD